MTPKREWARPPKRRAICELLGINHLIGFGAGGDQSAYSIAYSVRTKRASNARLSRTNGVPTSTEKGTIFGYFKRGQMDTAMALIGSSGTYDTLTLQADNALYVQTAPGRARITTQLFRDVAWVPFVFSFDTTNTAGGTPKQQRLWIGLTEVTSFSTDQDASGLSSPGWFANGTTQYIGYSQSTGQYFDGLHAQYGFVDGQELTGPDFFEQNSDGATVPRSAASIRVNVAAGGGARNGWGANGSLLLFNDATSTTTLGYDRSQSDTDTSGNNWTLTNITVSAASQDHDVLTDTPSRNFATLTHVTKQSNVTVSAGGLRATQSTNGSTNGTVFAPFVMRTGKWYWEVRWTTQYAGYAGIRKVSSNYASADFTGFAATDYAIDMSTGRTWNNNTGGTTYTAVGSGGTLMFAYDADAGKLWAGTAGTWYNSGNPDAGTGAVFTGIAADEMVAAITPYSSAGNFDVNFGQRDYTYSPASYNAATFKALNTANLAAVTIRKPSDAFKVTLATEDNIDADVATARGGWTDYLDIKKNRAAAESWAWQFSHDSANEYAIAAASVTRQAKRAMSGGNTWVGYSIRIGAAYGSAAGSVSHTNGADTTVTHNVGVSARQMVFLFPRAGGTTVKVFHPDLTSGKLLDLCGAAAEATDATIKTVTANSFKIDSAMATGTYDYLVLSEISGLLALGKFTGNASTDGPVVPAGASPSALFTRRIDAGADWHATDESRETFNPSDSFLFLNTNGAEATDASYRRDFLASGFKVRAAEAFVNASGGTFIYADFAKHAFGGSNVAPAPAR